MLKAGKNSTSVSILIVERAGMLLVLYCSYTVGMHPGTWWWPLAVWCGGQPRYHAFKETIGSDLKVEDTLDLQLDAETKPNDGCWSLPNSEPEGQAALQQDQFQYKQWPSSRVDR